METEKRNLQDEAVLASEILKLLEAQDDNTALNALHLAMHQRVGTRRYIANVTAHSEPDNWAIP